MWTRLVNDVAKQNETHMVVNYLRWCVQSFYLLFACKISPACNVIDNISVFLGKMLEWAVNKREVRCVRTHAVPMQRFIEMNEDVFFFHLNTALFDEGLSRPRGAHDVQV